MEEVDKRCLRIAMTLGLIWVAAWTALPSLLLGNSYIDVLENIVWARNFQFGYDKNPYFGAWLTHAAHWVTGESLWFSYLLSQLSVAAALVCVWKLSLRLMPQQRYALIAVLLLLLIPFYSSSATEFNDDVIELSLWAATIYFFHKATSRQHWFDWVMTGLFAGLAFMTKYYGVALLGSMGVFMLASPSGRKSFSRIGMYCCIAVFLLLSVPNLVWLLQNDLVSINYALERAHISEQDWSGHLINPLRLLGRCVEILAVALTAFAVCFRKRDPRCAPISPDNMIYLRVMCFGPLALTLLFSLLSGGKIRFTWVTPCFSLLGLFLAAAWRPAVSLVQIRLLVGIVALFGMVYAGGFTYKAVYESPFKRKSCRYEAFPGEAVSRELTILWRERFQSPVKYVIGQRRESCNFAVHSPDRPNAYFDADISLSPWIDERDIDRHGALVFWGADEIPPWLDNLMTRYSGRIERNPNREYPRATRSWLIMIFGQPKTLEIASAFIRPEPVAIAEMKQTASNNRTTR